MICLGGVVVSVVSGYALIPFAPTLLLHPLAHLLLTGSTTALIVGGAFARVGQLPLLVVVPAGVVGLTTFDVFFWWTGRRYGDRALRLLLARGGASPGSVAKTERWVARWGLWGLVASYFLPIPTVLVQLALGASGVSLAAFLLADLFGATLWAATLATLGYELGKPAVHVATVISHDALLSSVAIIVVLMLVGVVRGRRAVLAASAPAEAAPSSVDGTPDCPA